MGTFIAIGAMGRIGGRRCGGRDRMPRRAPGEEGGFFRGHQVNLLCLVFSEFFLSLNIYFDSLPSEFEMQ